MSHKLFWTDNSKTFLNKHVKFLKCLWNKIATHPVSCTLNLGTQAYIITWLSFGGGLIYVLNEIKPPQVSARHMQYGNPSPKLI